MKKTITALFLALALIIMSVAVYAAGNSDVNTADALNELGLFLGTGNGYELEKGLGRAEGVTLLVRMIGKEEAAKNNTYVNNFTDVPEWAAGYVGYAFENGITNGTGETTFAPDLAMTDYMFLTLVLRALDYSDKGEAPLFTWDNPYALAYELKLIETADPDTDFSRGDAIKVFWDAMDVKLYNSESTLADRLVEQGVFTAEELVKAIDIYENGRKENAGIPIVPTPETEAPETEAPETDAPETDAPETGNVDNGWNDPNAGEEDEFDAPETDAPETEAPETGNENVGTDDPDAGEEDIF